MPTRVLFVRHGQSTFNAQKRFQGCCDESVLTETGRLKAYQTGIALSPIAYDAVYASPLQRTQETASEILSAIATFTPQAPTLHLHPNLQEINFPIWEGLSYAYVREHLTQEYAFWKASPHEFQMEVVASPTGKGSAVATLPRPFLPLQDLYDRARQFWQETLPKYPDQTLLIVSHGGTIRALISTALGVWNGHYHRLQQSNCGISAVTFADAGQTPARLEAMNLTSHLGETLPKLKEGKQGLRLLLIPAETHLTARTQNLAELLQSVALDFCVSCDTAEAQATAEAILQRQSSPRVHLPVTQRNFLQDWQTSLRSQSLQSSTLLTGLAVAHPSAIRAMLNQVLGLPSEADCLQLYPGAISVLHYPAGSSNPVLQALNFNQPLSR